LHKKTQSIKDWVIIELILSRVIFFAQKVAAEE